MRSLRSPKLVYPFVASIIQAAVMSLLMANS